MYRVTERQIRIIFSPDVTPSGWLGSKHQLTYLITPERYMTVYLRRACYPPPTMTSSPLFLHKGLACFNREVKVCVRVCIDMVGGSRKGWGSVWFVPTILTISGVPPWVSTSVSEATHCSFFRHTSVHLSSRKHTDALVCQNLGPVGMLIYGPVYLWEEFPCPEHTRTPKQFIN